VRLLIKNLGRQKPEDVFRGELDALGFRSKGVFQLRSGQHDKEASKVNPLTANIIVSVARGHEVMKMCLQTELCALRVSVETMSPQRALWNGRAARVWHYGALLRMYTSVCCLWWDTTWGGVPQSSKLSVAAVVEFTEATNGF